MGHPMIADALLDALAVLAPVECAGCGEPDRAVCPACAVALTPHPAVIRLGRGLEVVSALRYETAVREVILALKERGRTDAARQLGPALAAAVSRAVRGEVELTTVPASAAGTRSRGYDPVRVLLRSARLPAVPSLLRRVRTTASQKTLDETARRMNVVGSLAARRPLSGRRIVIVDDVVTTGATIIEAARAITDAGGQVVGAATLAWAPRRSATGSAEPFSERGSPPDAP